MIQKVSLEKEEENDISIICGRQWEFPGIPAYGPLISLPISVIFPQCQYSQPESRILRTLVLMTVGYVWGLEIRIIKSSHFKSPLTASNLFALAATVTIPANTERLALDLYFDCSLQFRVTFSFQGSLDLISAWVSFVHYPFHP